jgi:hypothetical protein
LKEAAAGVAGNSSPGKCKNHPGWQSLGQAPAAGLLGETRPSGSTAALARFPGLKIGKRNRTARADSSSNP